MNTAAFYKYLQLIVEECGAPVFALPYDPERRGSTAPPRIDSLRVFVRIVELRSIASGGRRQDPGMRHLLDFMVDYYLERIRAAR